MRIDNSSPIRALLNEGRLLLPDACRAIRAMHGLSQDEFARRIGVNRKVVKDLESGAGNPGRVSLERIAGAAGLRVAFVPQRSAIAVMDPRQRQVQKQARRAEDAGAPGRGVSEPKKLYRRNAMSLGGVKLRLPRIG